MHIGAQRVEYAHDVAARSKLAQDMAADETGAAGEEHAHHAIRCIMASRRKVVAIFHAACSPAAKLPGHF